MRAGEGKRRAGQAARRGGPDYRLGSGHTRGERTSNMERMFVTLDVSKVSGWLNANMNCRVEMGNICDAGRGAGREAAQSGGGASGVPHGEGSDLRLWGQGTRGAHHEHAFHVRDVGRVEAQRLVEHGRALPSRKEGMQRRARCGSGGGMEWRRRERRVHGEGPTECWGPWHARRAHVEHPGHVRDAGRVEPQRLVEQ